MKTVKEVLERKSKSFNQISTGALVIEALQMLNSVNLSYLVVMDGDQFKGIFSERDYTRNVALKGRSSATTTVGEVMSVDLPIIGINDSVEQCMNKIDTFKTRYLLAYEDKKFMGVITIHDLLRMVIASRAEVFDDNLVQRLLDQNENIRVY
ncbi:MAG: CBS domain-containing protein [Chitinophagaceae bacterium]|nr:CBS domain-containing protein [Chitinophagaceae bacterium]